MARAKAKEIGATMLSELIKIANSLDSKGLYDEADRMDEIIKSFASDGPSPAQKKTFDGNNNGILWEDADFEHLREQNKAEDDEAEAEEDEACDKGH